MSVKSSSTPDSEGPLAGKLAGKANSILAGLTAGAAVNPDLSASDSDGFSDSGKLSASDGPWGGQF